MSTFLLNCRCVKYVCLYHGQEFLVSSLNKSRQYHQRTRERPTVTVSSKSRCSPAFVRSALPCSRCALLKSKDCERQANAHSTGEEEETGRLELA